MAEIKKSKALVSDFDGTISKIDFFYYIIAKLLSESDLQPWFNYQEGKTTHFKALNEIFQKIHLDTKKFNELILELPVENCFVKTVDYCYKNGIDFYIVSAGADFYIKVILENLNISNKVILIGNKSSYSVENGLNMQASDTKDPFYSGEYGISKKKVMETVKEKYNYVIFAGDGDPDIDAAMLADKVFARGKLLDLCKKNNINAEEFNSYCKILEYLKNEVIKSPDISKRLES